MYSIFERSLQIENGEFFALVNGYNKGREDATEAIRLAELYLQPQNTPIYFAIEPLDATSTDVKSAARDYYSGINSILEDLSINTNFYKLGFYGVADLYKALTENDTMWNGINIAYYFFPGSSGSNFYTAYNQSHIYTIRQMDEIDLIYTVSYKE